MYGGPSGCFTAFAQKVLLVTPHVDTNDGAQSLETSLEDHDGFSIIPSSPTISALLSMSMHEQAFTTNSTKLTLQTTSGSLEAPAQRALA